MKVKKIVLFIVTIAIMLFLNFTIVLAFNMPDSNVPLRMIHLDHIAFKISGIMRLSTCIILISYLVFVIIYTIKSKEDKIKKIKKLIKWFIIVVIISLILWFGSIPVEEIAYY